MDNILSVKNLSKQFQSFKLNDINFADYWEQADTAARKQFGDLSERQMLNGFYLQEVMHRYAELITSAILL